MAKMEMKEDAVAKQADAADRKVRGPSKLKDPTVSLPEEIREALAMDIHKRGLGFSAYANALILVDVKGRGVVPKDLVIAVKVRGGGGGGGVSKKAHEDALSEIDELKKKLAAWWLGRSS